MKLESQYFYNIYKNKILKHIRSNSGYINIFSKKSIIQKGALFNV